MTLTEREAEVRLARIQAAQVLGSELSPWAIDVVDALETFIEGDYLPSRSALTLCDLGSRDLCNQLEEDVRTMDDFGEYQEGVHPEERHSPRTVAGWWHGGQASALYSYSSAGFISPRLVAEVVEAFNDGGPEDVAAAELRSILEAIVCGS